MRKILILTNLDVGLYNFRREVLEALLAVPYEIHIALPAGDFVPKMEEMGCIFHETKLERRGMNPRNELALYRRYKEVIAEVKPDIALTYTIKPNVYGGICLGKAGVPFITNITGLGTAVEGDGILQKIMSFLYRKAMKKAGCIFFQNEMNERVFTERRIGLGKHKMLPGSGVNTERFSLLPFPGEDEPVSFLYISRVMKEKGIDQFLEMAEVIKSEYKNTEFHILGFCEDDETSPESYRKRIDELERKGIVSFEGMIEDIRPFLEKSQCTVHPSFYPEGMSNVCLESASSGRCVITTDRPGCMDTVDDGISGFIVKQRDSESLINAVRKFLELPYEERKVMGLRGRQKMVSHFDRKYVVNAYLEEIEDLLKKK